MNIRTLCLGILQFEDATGYEINKLVADGRFSHFIEASYGSIYPALTKMMHEELVTCRDEVQAGKPSRKIYSITTAGQQELFETLKTTPQPNRFKSEFLFFCLFAGTLPKDHMKKAIESHEQELATVIEDLRGHIELCNDPGSRFAIGYGIAAKEATLEFVRHNKECLLKAEPIEAGSAPRKSKEKSYE